MDPVTIGALVASVLGETAEALLKGAVSAATKDGYKALKSKIAAWAGADVKSLESTPKSAARRALVAEAIDAQAMDEQTAVLELAQRLLAALKEPDVSRIGLDVARLDALAVELRGITVIEGTGVRIGHVSVQGDTRVGHINGGRDAKISALPGDPTINPPKPPPRR